GGSSFALLQAAFQEEKKQQLTYVVFDLLHLDGHNLRNLPLERRKAILQALLRDADNPDFLRFSEHLDTNGIDIFNKACQLGAEGIVSKRRSAPYVSGKNGTWLKIKCIRQQEFVIGGFTPPSKSGVGVGALLLGYYDGGDLIYAGRTGTGFTEATRKHRRKELESIRAEKTAFATVPRAEQRDGIWVEPKLAAEVNFASWTADGLVRQSSFQGIREDKDAKEVVREEAGMITKPERKARSAKVTPVAAKRVSGMSGKDEIEVDGVRLTSPDKVVDEESRLTKLQLANYYSAVR